MAIALAKSLLDTLDLRAGSTITQSEIDALKRRWSPRGRLVRKAGDYSRVCAEYGELGERLPMRVSDEQGKKGLDYLRKLLLKKDGTLRATKLVNREGLTEDHALVIRTADHFMFVGFQWDHNDFYTVYRPQPAYRLVASNGMWFEYVARPWVQGEPAFAEVCQRINLEEL